MTPELQLVRPDATHVLAFGAALPEFHAEGRLLDVHPDGVAAHVRELRLSAVEPGQYGVRETVLWALLGREFVGRVNLRHDLTPELRLWGGHIGYEVRPSARRRGVGRALLRGALPHARALGLTRVLLTCDDTNLASIRIIEGEGGVLEDITPGPQGERRRRYWIALPGQP